MTRLILWCVVPWVTGFALVIAVACARMLLRARAHVGRLDVVFFGHYMVMNTGAIIIVTIATLIAATALSIFLSNLVFLSPR